MAGQGRSQTDPYRPFLDVESSDSLTLASARRRAAWLSEKLGLSTLTQSCAPTSGEYKPGKGDPLLKKEPTNEIEWTAERFRRYSLHAVATTLQRDSHDDATDGDGERKHGQPDDGHH